MFPHINNVRHLKEGKRNESLEHSPMAWKGSIGKRHPLHLTVESNFLLIPYQENQKHHGNILLTMRELLLAKTSHFAAFRVMQAKAQSLWLTGWIQVIAKRRALRKAASHKLQKKPLYHLQRMKMPNKIINADGRYVCFLIRTTRRFTQVRVAAGYQKR